MSALRIAFLGAGNMAQALAKGVVAAGVTEASNITASCPVADKHLLEEMKKMGCRVTYCNKEATAGSDVTILAVKPAIVGKVLKEMGSLVTPKAPLVASIAMGVPIASLEADLPPLSRVVRCMPNTPALLMHGASVYCRGNQATEEDAETTRSLLSSVGECHEVPESFLDAVTGLSGAGPAYAFLIVEALADGGVQMGLPRPLALRLAAQTVLGGAKMVLETGCHPGLLKDNVCSPGGCSIEGVAALEAGGVRGALMTAVKQATLRARAIGNTLS